MDNQQATKILDMFLHKQCDLERTRFAYSQNEIWEAVSLAAQAIQHTNIVQCKDCVFSEDVDDQVKKIYSTDCIKCTKHSTDGHDVLMLPIDYCNYGVRKYDPITGAINIRIDKLSSKQRELLDQISDQSETYTDEQIQKLKSVFIDSLTINLLT